MYVFQFKMIIYDILIVSKLWLFSWIVDFIIVILKEILACELALTLRRTKDFLPTIRYVAAVLNSGIIMQ